MLLGLRHLAGFFEQPASEGTGRRHVRAADVVIAAVEDIIEAGDLLDLVGLDVAKLRRNREPLVFHTHRGLEVPVIVVREDRAEGISALGIIFPNTRTFHRQDQAVERMLTVLEVLAGQVARSSLLHDPAEPQVGVLDGLIERTVAVLQVVVGALEHPLVAFLHGVFHHRDHVPRFEEFVDPHAVLVGGRMQTHLGHVGEHDETIIDVAGDVVDGGVVLDRVFDQIALLDAVASDGDPQQPEGAVGLAIGALEFVGVAEIMEAALVRVVHIADAEDVALEAIRLRRVEGTLGFAAPESTGEDRDGQQLRSGEITAVGKELNAHDVYGRLFWFFLLFAVGRDRGG